MLSSDPKIPSEVLEQKDEIQKFCEKLFPICRSITGDGTRETLHTIQEIIPLNIKEIASGTSVLDWVIPKEWNINAAWIKDSKGRTIVDFKENNLHILQYSTPIHQKMELSSLKSHLFSLPEFPDAIPYRTSYYQENWGFCLNHNTLSSLEDGIYEVYIDSTLTDGSLTYGEVVIPGECEEEVLFSTHICHPSLANDNVSGMAALSFLGSWLQKQQLKYTYRLIFVPGTIGAITWLDQNISILKKVKFGLVTSLLGNNHPFTYKKTKSHVSEIDLLMEYTLRDEIKKSIVSFSPYGYDERQFNSPGINLDMGYLSRSTFGSFKEYHTSFDNLSFIDSSKIKESISLLANLIDNIENATYYINTFPDGEPQLGRRGMYDAIGGNSDSKEMQMAMLWVLNYSNGSKSLESISTLSGIGLNQLKAISLKLLAKGLIKKA